MISVDQLEVLLRSIPQYFLFGGLGLYLYAWIEKKPERGIFAEILFVIIGIAAILVLLSGMIPSPLTEGLVKAHVEMVIRMLGLLCVTGVLAGVSITIRILRKKHWNPLILVIFIIGILIFFSSTKLSKVKFELNVPPTTEVTE
ncbi:MAG: hypothetical protein PF541_07120 [Prolixibacteraceae bacterium]|jgi:hypothetical protein|nr:hypothetical protein [Prolixibacteraceae bacterium]